MVTIVLRVAALRTMRVMTKISVMKVLGKETQANVENVIEELLNVSRALLKMVAINASRKRKHY